MSIMENDEKIRVNIRTGTSTRVPRPRSVEIDPPSVASLPPLEGEITIQFGTNLPVNSYRDLLHMMHMANMTTRGGGDEMVEVMNRSLYDTELRRNPSIRLDIRPHHCKTTEVNGDCSVCQGKFQLGEKLSTIQNCCHTFHYQCLQQWGMYKQECPLCRGGIPILER